MNKIRPDTRDAILEAAFQVFNERPAASLEDVAKAAGVGRATLHRHFSSRSDLMLALANTATTELNEAIEIAVTDAKSHTEGLRLALVAMIPLASRQWFLMHEKLDEDPQLLASYEKDLEELKTSIEAAKGEGTFAPDVPATWILEAYQALIYSAWTMVRDGECTSRQAAELAWRTLVNGLKEQKK